MFSSLHKFSNNSIPFSRLSTSYISIFTYICIYLLYEGDPLASLLAFMKQMVRFWCSKKHYKTQSTQSMWVGYTHLYTSTQLLDWLHISDMQEYIWPSLLPYINWKLTLLHETWVSQSIGSHYQIHKGFAQSYIHICSIHSVYLLSSRWSTSV